MYFIGTIFLGWAILNSSIGVLELLLQLEPGYIQEIVLIYIIIGYFIMFLYGIKSPLTPKDNEHPFHSMKKIELKSFFKDIYLHFGGHIMFFTKINEKYLLQILFL